ncbi:MAG: tryptophan--tRNA ligase [Promethearchaeota archaeon]
MSEFKVTPWEVEGVVDYDKLIEEFGTQRIDQNMLERIRGFAGELHLLLRRGYFFSHRDLDKALDAYESGEGFFLYTGRGPTGDMHLGHLIPLIFCKWIQDKFDANLHIQITDDEKFLYKHTLSLDKTRKYSYENILDIIACDLNPEKTFIFQDSEYTNIYPLATMIAKRITFSTAKAVFGFTNQTNIGMIFFPAIQAVPCFLEEKQCLIPAAIDQDPYWRVQRDVAPKLGYKKTAAIHSKFLPSLEGPKGKMSASKQETAIYLTDTPEEVRTKVQKHAFTGGQPTVKEQKEKGGNPDICTIQQWLSIFLESDDEKVREQYMRCKQGTLLCGEHKDLLVEKLNEFLRGHQRRREDAKKLVETFKHTGKLAKTMWTKKW